MTTSSTIKLNNDITTLIHNYFNLNSESDVIVTDESNQEYQKSLLNLMITKLSTNLKRLNSFKFNLLKDFNIKTTLIHDRSVCVEINTTNKLIIENSDMLENLDIKILSNNHESDKKRVINVFELITIISYVSEILLFIDKTSTEISKSSINLHLTHTPKSLTKRINQINQNRFNNEYDFIVEALSQKYGELVSVRARNKSLFTTELISKFINYVLENDNRIDNEFNKRLNMVPYIIEVLTDKPSKSINVVRDGLFLIEIVKRITFI